MPGLLHLYCDTCGAANRPQARFCFACGQLLSGSGQSLVPATSPPGGTGRLPSAYLLRGRYRILGRIGQGGFGAVYRAEDMSFAQRPVAVKELSQNHLNPQELQEATGAFQRESQLLAGLTHPNLPRIYDHFNEGGRWYLVMDFIEGETLEEHLNRVPDGRLPLETVLQIGIQLCSVLGYLHSRQPAIIFRDLKPANVILTGEGHVYLIDFGIARLFKPGQARDTTAFGSAGYAAPEQYGKAQSTPRTDIYALGATLHQLITGEDPSLSPFTFAPFPQQDLPHRRLEALMLRMVQLEASRRPASMEEVKRELEEIVRLQLLASSGATAIPATGRGPTALASAPASPPLLQWTTHCIYRGHRQAVQTIVWSPDSHLLASGSSDGTLQIWEALSGQRLLICSGHRGPIYSVAWSPDGQRLASGGRDGLVRLWNARDGSLLLTQQIHSSYIYSLAWSPDGLYLASASEDHSVQVWAVDNPSDSSAYRGHRAGVKAVAWAPDGRRLASGGKDRMLRIWPRPHTKGKSILTYFLSYMNQTQAVLGQRIDAIAWAPDGRSLATGRVGGVIEIWDSQRLQTLLTYHRHRGPVYALSWSPGGRLLASGGREGVVHIWGATSGQQLCAYNSHRGFILAVAWAPNGKYVASAGNDGTVQVWAPHT